MTECEQKHFIVKLLSFIYSMAIRIPVMYIGYSKDKIALSRRFNDPVFNGLKHKGLYLFPSLLPGLEVEALLRDFEELKKTKALDSSGQLTGRIFAYGVLSPVLQDYINNVRPHVCKFLNTQRVHVEISYYQESYPLADFESIPGGEFHVDDNKANLKYFIYLTDVDEDAGAFSCVPSTGSWKLKGSLVRGMLWALTGERKYHYEYLLNKPLCIANEKKILGSSGTHFLVDTTTLHRAHPVKNGCRKVAVISFNRAT